MTLFSTIFIFSLPFFNNIRLKFPKSQDPGTAAKNRATIYLRTLVIKILFVTRTETCRFRTSDEKDYLLKTSTVDSEILCKEVQIT